MTRFLLLLAALLIASSGNTMNAAPIGPPGLVATYHHGRGDGIPAAVVKSVTVSLGDVHQSAGRTRQWLRLQATKKNGERLQIWILTPDYPSPSLAVAREGTARYILGEANDRPLEFRERFTGKAVLPVIGGWAHLFPRATSDTPGKEVFPPETLYLGHRYRRESLTVADPVAAPPESDVDVIELLPDVLVGMAINRRQKDETRRFDNSDYELVPLTRADYLEMVDAGINCLRVDPDQVSWVNRLDAYHWGPGGAAVDYPECLYRSNYLGPALYLDEPAVGTRDHVIRPRMKKDPKYRKSLTPQIALEEFRTYFYHKKHEGSPRSLLRGLAARPDVDVGTMDFPQANLYTWETVVSSALHQLTEGGGGSPSAIVFEPPGRVGTRRILPEINMTYGCQIPVDDPKSFADIIYGFLRGAARAADGSWGMSIYGHVDRTDTFWLQTHAYDLGARLFFFWNSYQLACLPHGECLALARNLRAHVEHHPRRDLRRLRRAAEVAILFPPGYNLGHVHMGKGSLWGVGELNLERINRKGVSYRVVMGNFFTEIERCIRLGVAYDLLWDLEGVQLPGFREVVRIREDGRVEIDNRETGQRIVRDGPRVPVRPRGTPPRLTVDLSATAGTAPLEVTARATVLEGSAAVYYTLGADAAGVYSNARVLWELYGPQEEDYRFLLQELRGERQPRVSTSGDTHVVEIDFQIDRPGTYRLRAATVDLAGRTAVTWKRLTLSR